MRSARNCKYLIIYYWASISSRKFWSYSAVWIAAFRFCKGWSMSLHVWMLILSYLLKEYQKHCKYKSDWFKNVKMFDRKYAESRLPYIKIVFQGIQMISASYHIKIIFRSSSILRGKVKCSITSKETSTEI